MAPISSLPYFVFEIIVSGLAATTQVGRLPGRFEEELQKSEFRKWCYHIGHKEDGQIEVAFNMPIFSGYSTTENKLSDRVAACCLGALLRHKEEMDLFHFLRIHVEQEAMFDLLTEELAASLVESVKSVEGKWYPQGAPAVPIQFQFQILRVGSVLECYRY